MRVVIQRVRSASVEIDGLTTGAIATGLCVLVGFAPGDTPEAADWMADKVTKMRIFPDEEGKMNRSVTDVGGDVLTISQFTLYGDARKGNRPSFIEAAAPAEAIPLYERFRDAVARNLGKPVQAGIFGADMLVRIENDGPVTLIVDR